MSGLNATEDQEVTFISGVTPQGTIAGQSFWTWDDNLPATYSSSLSYEAKWGSPQAGTGGSLKIAFDPASAWTSTEQAAFTAAMHLWSAEANITFDILQQWPGFDVLISRGTDHKASGGLTQLDTGDIGSSHLGTA